MKMVWEEMPTTSRTCWMSLLSLCFLRSLLANLERVLPQFGMDKYLAAWGNILAFRLTSSLRKKIVVFYLGNWAFIMILWSFFEVYISRARHSNECVLKFWE